MSLRHVVVLCTMVAATNLWAGESPFGCRLWSRCGTSHCPSLGGSADDYCRKPCPVIEPVSRCGSCDDYCRKPMPCLENISRCGECDDYCRQSIPCLLCPPFTPYLYYGSAEGCCAPARRP